MFDRDNGGSLDRKECQKLLNCTIYGLTKLAGLPSPQKSRVTTFISDVFHEIDADGSGVVDYQELKDYIDNSMEIQDFVLRYSGVQTLIRAQKIFNAQNEYWASFFRRIAIDYFGDYFVEYHVLRQRMEEELQDY